MRQRDITKPQLSSHIIDNKSIKNNYTATCIVIGLFGL